MFSKPLFLCLVAGYAAQTAMLIGLSTFGSAFMMGLGYFDTVRGVLHSVCVVYVMYTMCNMLCMYSVCWRAFVFVSSIRGVLSRTRLYAHAKHNMCSNASCCVSELAHGETQLRCTA